MIWFTANASKHKEQFGHKIYLSNVPELAEGSIEQRYAQQGSYRVKVEEVKHASVEALFRIYYPAFQGDESYPVISWGNGTDATPDLYDKLLTHLASWGFL
ncbi:hypothetical protein J22TS3_32260 [Paenibacillus sp. J22TS3]|nr:hypothetical protein J22TS3_32260 [Paenibacillus sp. J22TS3]